MKKKIIIGAIVASFVSLGFATSGVHADSARTDITGVVTLNHTVGVKNAKGTVTCNGWVKTDMTDAQGFYLVSFTVAHCPFGSTTKVTATKGGYSGVASGTVQGLTTKLNLAIINVDVPEYGLLGMLIAGAAGMGSKMIRPSRGCPVLSMSGGVASMTSAWMRA